MQLVRDLPCNTLGEEWELTCRTPAIEAAMKESPADQALFAATVERTPVGPRLGQSEEVAYAVGILCEDRAAWMNGNHIHVNGGLVIG
jgi:NAD(P)-dependent dehydrogenase (short-subunit alcohol dehydrogenase family)